MILRFIGYLLLTIIPIVLMIVEIVLSKQSNIFINISAIIMIIGILINMIDEINHILYNYFRSFFKGYIMTFFSVIFGTLIAYFIEKTTGMGIVTSAALSAIIGSFIFPTYSVAFYSGSFISLISPTLQYDFYHLLFASILTSAVFILTYGVYDGYGGKLGAKAFAGWFILSVIFKIDIYNNKVQTNISPLLIFIIAFLSSYIIYKIHGRYDNRTVLYSGIMSFIGSIIFSIIFKDNTSIILSKVLMAASFAGMSKTERVYNNYYQLFISFFVALLFSFTASNYVGAGGKLGALAFGCVIGTMGIIKAVAKIQYILKNKES